MRATTLIATVAALAATGALLLFFSRGASDAPPSLSAEHVDPLTALDPATDPAVLAGVRRSAESAADDTTSADGEPPAAPRADEAPVAAGVETSPAALAPPEALLLVDAVQLDGAAVAGAVVHLELLSLGPTGAMRPSFERATTDERGRAQFPLSGLADVCAAGVIARLAAAAPAPRVDQRGSNGPPRLTSALVRLETPLHAPMLARPVRLVLDVPATVCVRARTQHGAPLAGQVVLVDDLDPELGWWRGGMPVTDERGEASDAGLPAGNYRVSLLGDAGGEPRDLVLVAGERAELEFVVEVQTLDVAASGRVLDEEGRPLAGREVSARVSDGTGPPRVIDAGTDEEGRFELLAAPCERLVVSASLGLFVDEYEPGELEVLFGTRDLVFRRTRTVPFEAVTFDVVDAGTGQLVHDVLVMTYRARAPADYAFHTARDGRAAPRCSLHADTTCLLEAPGYRRRAVLAVDLAATAPSGEVPRVTLEPGVLRELRVVDTAGRPVVGAVVGRGPNVLGTTDTAGLFVVDLRAWPAEGLTVTAERHAPATWIPRDGFADLAPAEVVLAGE